MRLSDGQTEDVDEFVFTLGSSAECHASTVVELSNGHLLAAWFSGSREGAEDVTIWGARRTENGWSSPVEMVREPGTSSYNPVLFHTQEGRLWLYYKFGGHPMSWTAGRRWSIDEGKTWSSIEHLPAGIYGPARTKPLVLGDGTVISGTSVESYRSWACWIEWSSDHGVTWAKAGPIILPTNLERSVVKGQAPPAVPGSSEWSRTDGIIQPSVVWMQGNHLRLYARSTALTGKICIADSKDRGLTWSRARPIDLPNPNSGIDALRLRDGRVLIIYNHSDNDRTPLNMAISRDGENFQMFRTLENDPGEYSYPALIQGERGDLHITYTWNRRRIKYLKIPLSAIPSGAVKSLTAGLSGFVVE